MIFEEITKKQFDNFSRNHEQASFYQTTNWGDLKEDNGWKAYYVGVKQNKKIVAASLLLYKKLPMNMNIFYSPRGFLIDYNNYDLLSFFTTKLKEFIKRKNAIFLKIDPYIIYQERNIDGDIVENGKNNKNAFSNLTKLGYKHFGFNKMQETLQPRWISILNLEGKTAEELLKDMRQTTRWMINKSQKNCITIKNAKFEDIGDFKKVMNHTAERREFIDRPLSYYQRMFKILNRDNMIKILLAEINLGQLKDTLKNDCKHLKDRISNIEGNTKKEAQIKEYKAQIDAINKRLENIDAEIDKYGNKFTIAAGLYICYGKEVVYLFGGSYKEFMGYGAQYLMQYEVIKYAKENNYYKLNFYGIDGNFEKGSKNYGLFDFKRGFNSNVVELIGEFDLITNKLKYYTYKLAFKTYKTLKNLIKK